MNLDTSFLIDLHREYRRGVLLGARAFLETHPSSSFSISAVVITEFLEGASKPEDSRFLDLFQKIPLDEAIAREAASIRRTLRTRGELIGDFDILIAATAMTNGVPLVTANLHHFKRVKGLKCIPYRTD